MVDRRVKFDIIGDAADGKRAFRETADEAHRAGDAIDHLGDNFSGLDDEIKKTTESSARLRKELASTGDRGLLADLAREDRVLKRLQAVRKEMTGLGDDEDKFVRRTGKSISDTITSLPAQIKGGAIVGIGAAIAAVGPMAAASIASLVTGALATGAVAGGVVLAFQDQRVKNAGQLLADDVKSDMINAGQAFVGPTIQGIARIQSAWRSSIGPDIQATLKAATYYVDPLARAMAGVGQELASGLRYAVERAGPVVDMLADELPDVAHEVGDLMRVFGDNSKDSAVALRDVLVLLELSVSQLAGVVDLSTKAYAVYKDLEGVLGGVLQVAMLWQETNGGSETKQAADDTQTLAARLRDARGAAAAAADAVRDFNRAISDQINQTLNADQAAIAFKQGMMELKGELAANGRTLKETTAAGLANRDALLEQINKANRMREAAIAMGDGSKEATDKANAAFRGQLAQVRALALAMGLPKAQVDALLASYMAIVRAPNITKTIKIEWKFLQSGSMPPPNMRNVYAMSTGGPIRGGLPGVDSVPLLGMPGEYVLRRDMVDRLGGLDFLESMRTGRARPGPTRDAPATMTSPGPDLGGLVRLVAAEIRTALHGATLIIDDRTGTRASLMVRAG